MYFSKLTLILINILLLFLGIIPMYNKKIYKIVMYFQILIYTLFYGLRNQKIGVDTKNYLFEYRTGTGGYFEIGFQKLGYILYKLKFSETEYLSFIILVQLLFIYLGINNYKIKNSIKGIIMWGMLTNTIVVFNTINGLRQGIAASILFYVMSLFQNKKTEFIKGASYIIHKSSLIFLGIRIWRKFEKKKLKNLNNYIIFFLVIFTAGYISKDIFVKLNFFSSSYINRGSQILLIKIFQLLIIFSIILFVKKKEKRVLIKEQITNIVTIYSFLIVIITGFFFINEVANRFYYYSSYYIYLIFIMYINIYKNKMDLIKVFIIVNFIYYCLIINTPQYMKMFIL